MSGILNILWFSSIYIAVTGIVLIIIRWMMKVSNCRKTSIYQLWFLFPFGLLLLTILQITDFNLAIVPEFKILVLPTLKATIQNRNEIPPIQSLFIYLWASIALVLILKLIYKYFNFKKSLHTNASILINNVYKSDFIKAPLAFGIVIPSVYLPKYNYQIFTKQQQRFLLEHELIHCKRYDPLLRMVYQILESIFCFHPMIYILNNKMKFDQEVSVDQLVLDRTNEDKLKIEYSKLLLQIQQNNNIRFTKKLPEHYCSSISMLKERIMLIKNRKPTNKNLNRFISITLILIAITAVIVTTTSLANTTKTTAPPFIPEPPRIGTTTSEPPKEPKVHKSFSTDDSIEIIPIVRIAPNYPRKAAVEKITGYVTMDVDIAPNGKVENVRIVESVPNELFDVEAVKSVMKYEFSPIAHTVTIRQTVDFKLD